MYLNKVITAQKQGEPRGIPSLCSAHPQVLQAAMHSAIQSDSHLLIESTCNQVNQFGGYTGMTPKDFVAYINKLAEQHHFPLEKIILGGDHLGPNVWQNEPAQTAMEKSAVMLREYVQAGYQKIHLDCSMRLGDDPPGPFSPLVAAQRSAWLARVAENESKDAVKPLYVIGTEVPVPGGANNQHEGIHVTQIADLEVTLAESQAAFLKEGLSSAWERVIAVVVQPGVEFGDDFVLAYNPAQAAELAGYIASRAQVYEAHSTDYQTAAALSQLVRDHFAILKVGPELTFAYREAVFALAQIEGELISSEESSNLIAVLDDVMLQDPRYWQGYYHGDQNEMRLARKYSLSDRVRYYWQYPRVQAAQASLIRNLHTVNPPAGLLGQYAPWYRPEMSEKAAPFRPGEVIATRIQQVVGKYQQACGG